MEKKVKKNVAEQNAETVIVKTAIVPTPGDDLQQEIERKSNELQKCLQELTRKKELSDRRKIFINSIDKVEEFRQSLIEEQSNIDSRNGSIRFFKTANAYRTEDAVLSVSNIDVILEMLGYIEGKIKEKIVQLEEQLIA